MQFLVAVDDLPAQQESREDLAGFGIGPVEDRGSAVQLQGCRRDRPAAAAGSESPGDIGIDSDVPGLLQVPSGHDIHDCPDRVRPWVTPRRRDGLPCRWSRAPAKCWRRMARNTVG